MLFFAMWRLAQGSAPRLLGVGGASAYLACGGGGDGGGARCQSSSRTPPASCGSAAISGTRTFMEDAVFVSPDLCFAAVFDGHGGALQTNAH